MNLYKLINYLENNKIKSIDEIVLNFAITKDVFLELIKNNFDGDKQIVISPKENVYLISNKIKAGLLKIAPKGYGFIKNENIEEGDYFVPKINLNGAISEDFVYFELSSFNGKQSASIIEIVERGVVNLVGNIKRDGNFLDFNPNQQAFKSYLFRIVQKKSVPYREKDIVVAKIINIDKNKLFVSIEKVIGRYDRMYDRILSIGYENNINIGFSEEALNEADKNAKTLINDNQEINERLKTSLLDIDFVTIDGSDSKDLDDAIYVKKRNNGFQLIVSIADVSYFVKENSILDKEALTKGNSTYLANRVLPMLPEILSNNVCSLNPNERKFCLACIIEFDTNGNVLSEKVIKSLMISRARLTYDEVNDLFAGKIIDRDQKIIDLLNCARELHYLIEKNKKDRSAIEFYIPEPKIILNSDGNVLDICLKKTGESEKLIENFMVAANESVARIGFKTKKPFIYRSHELPEVDNLIEWYNSMKMLGINIVLTDSQKRDPKNTVIALKYIDEQVSDEKQKILYNVSLLRYMQKANYNSDKHEHFGLDSKCYTHFTSPIRRYSDLIVHRLLKKYIIENDEINLKEISRAIKIACPIINVTEKKSINAERDVAKVCMAEYMQKFVNKEFEGIISGVVKYGIFVQIEKGIEGMVHISNLEDFIFDEKNGAFINSQNKIYRLGYKIKIKVLNSDVEKRVIDFVIIE